MEGAFMLIIGDPSDALDVRDDGEATNPVKGTGDKGLREDGAEDTTGLREEGEDIERTGLRTDDL